MNFLHPQWPYPPGVQALSTTRQGGVSTGPWSCFNLGGHVGDDPAHVAENRRRLLAHLPQAPRWLQQVHGVAVLDLDDGKQLPDAPEADAAISRQAGVVCAVMTADCLPVLFAAKDGSVVGAAHAGWRGLCAGVLERTLLHMAVQPDALQAWLGPAIGPQAFEVGPEVREAFLSEDPAAHSAFTAGQADRWLADIYALARLRLMRSGLRTNDIYGGDYCTVTDAARFFSYRRDGQTGRMATMIWRE